MVKPVKPCVLVLEPTHSTKSIQARRYFKSAEAVEQAVGGPGLVVLLCGTGWLKKCQKITVFVCFCACFPSDPTRFWNVLGVPY